MIGPLAPLASITPLIAGLGVGAPTLGELFPFALFGWGCWLLLTAKWPRLGRPRPDLAERLRLLDADERLHHAVGDRAARPFFASRILETFLRPIVEDAATIVRRTLARFGRGDEEGLGRDLAAAYPELDPAGFWGQKVALGLLGLTMVPGANFILSEGTSVFAPWPLLTWPLPATLSFLLPDYVLSRKVRERRGRIVMELPAIVELLRLCLSAGQGIEQGLRLVAEEGAGIVADELRRALREMQATRKGVPQVLKEMADRNGVPELTSFVRVITVTDKHGTRLTETLGAQAATLRHQKRLHIQEEGEKATVKMLMPVALLILPVFFIVILYPALVQMLGLGG